MAVEAPTAINALAFDPDFISERPFKMILHFPVSPHNLDSQTLKELDFLSSINPPPGNDVFWASLALGEVPAKDAAGWRPIM